MLDGDALRNDGSDVFYREDLSPLFLSTDNLVIQWKVREGT